MPPSPESTPLEIQALGKPTIRIRWSDGTETLVKAFDLRCLCPCAGCVEEMTGIRTLKPGDIQKNVTATSIAPIGRYAIQIFWSDGHSTGVYSFDYLKKVGSS